MRDAYSKFLCGNDTENKRINPYLIILSENTKTMN